MSADNPDLDAIAGDETITVRRAALMAMFDLAVGSLDWGSGFWGSAETLVARELAEALGICPMAATPPDQRGGYLVCEGLVADIKRYTDLGYEPEAALKFANHEDHEVPS